MKVLTCKTLLFGLALMPVSPLLANKRESWLPKCISSWIPACSSGPTWVDKIPLCITRWFINSQTKPFEAGLDNLKRQQQEISQNVINLKEKSDGVEIKLGQYARTFADLQLDVGKRFEDICKSAGETEAGQKRLNAILARNRENFNALNKDLAAGVVKLDEFTKRFETFEQETLGNIDIIKETQASNYDKLKNYAQNELTRVKEEVKTVATVALSNEKAITELKDQIAQLNASMVEAREKRVAIDTHINDVYAIAKQQNKQLKALAFAFKKKEMKAITYKVDGKF